MSEENKPDDGPGNFVEDMIDADLQSGKHAGRLVTRFPPEPNGYLHIGHAKAITLNFGLGQKTPEARCHLRFDDTNPANEETEYVESIQNDIRWLGFDWGEHLYFASDYFETLYQFAIKLIKDGKAYVDTQTEEEIREGRGNFYKPGVESPFRNRAVEENLSMFEKMRTGEYEDGTQVLRAKIDMESKDIKLRDPLLYRIKRVTHHRTGDDWPIYPMYDFAHGQSDAIEKVTHSLCTLEFVNHRPLYNWFTEHLGFEDPPEQTEFAKLQISYIVLSKRRLKRLVDENHVDGWDDPRMPTLAGFRRLGYPPESIVAFCERVGVAKKESMVDIALLEHIVRERLNAVCPRTMAVLNPLKIVIENFDEGRTEMLEAAFQPDDPEAGSRKVPFGRELYIEREDFMMDPPKKWFRLAPGREVRLRYACLLTCKEVIEKDGEVVELRCEWDPDSLGGNAPDGRRVRGTLHWVDAKHAVDAEVHLYDRLFQSENPMGEEGTDFIDHLNPESRVVRANAKLEPHLGTLGVDDRVQFERLGYFIKDAASTEDKPLFNRTISLKDSWSRKAKQRK